MDVIELFDAGAITAIVAMIIGLFSFSFKKLNDIKEIKSRLLILSFSGACFVFIFIIAAIVHSDAILVSSGFTFYILLFSWRIISDLIRYKKEIAGRTPKAKKSITNSTKDNLSSGNRQYKLEPANYSLEELLKVVGKLFFIKYYYQLKNWQESDLYDIVEEKYDKETARSRILAGKTIFNQRKNIVALKTIIAQPFTVDNEALITAEKILKEELAPIEKNAEESMNIKYTKIIKAQTHAEFLNTVFGSDLKKFYRCICWYSKEENFAIWMIRLYKSSEENWQNRLINKNNEMFLREKYVGNDAEPIWNGKPITLENLVGKRRLVVEVEDRFDTREYKIIGVFELCEDSTDLNRLYKKIPNDTAQALIPEAF